MKQKSSASKTSWNLLLVFAILGWANAFVSLWHRAKLTGLSAETSSFCNISEKINCDTVAASSYSVFLGIPVAGWGLIFYMLVIFMTIWSYFRMADHHEDEAAAGASWVFLTAVIGVVMSFVLAGISYFGIGAICLLCVITYVINILIGVFAMQVYAGSSKRLPLVDRLSLPFSKLGGTGWGIFAALLAFHFFLPYLVDHSVNADADTDSNTPNLAIQSYQVTAAKTFNYAGFPTFGDEHAKVTVIEFSDFQCPHCAKSAVVVPPLLHSYQGKVRYVYKPYPLDSNCNPQMKTAAHPLACTAAKAGLCVFDKKGSPAFFEFKKNIFDHQPELSVELIKKIALDQGLKDTEVDACLADPQIRQRIVDATQEGTTNGVEGTPAIFVNGRQLQLGPQPRAMKAVIDFALKN